MTSKLPSFSQWRQVFSVLKKKEKVTLLIFSLFAAGSLVFLVTTFYTNNTNIVPAAGGTYVEGVVGQPRFINPIYGETNDVDRTLVGLVFSGLMAHDGKGRIVADAAENYTISDEGKTYEFTLRNNILWHDGKPLTADDVIFTIATIQNSDYKSPLRANWLDIEAEKISERSVRFRLKAPYNSFLENSTVKILPQHIWKGISPENFLLSPYNLRPIGSGPYKFSSVTQADQGSIMSLTLEANDKYFQKSPYITTLSFRFFDEKEDLVRAVNGREINGFPLSPLDNNEALAQRAIRQGWLRNQKFTTHSFSMPRYFAVFFNTQKASVFSDGNLRQAFTQAVNKDELISTISKETSNTIAKVDSPILPDFFGYNPPATPQAFNLAESKTLLDKAGFKEAAGGIREKALTKKPAFQFASYLKIGSQGKEVTELQGCLARLSPELSALLKDETNGKYGKGTDAAVLEFQKKYLPDQNPTGETGTATRNKLNELCIPPSESTQPLAITLTTVNQPQLVETANLLKGYWQQMGAQVEVKAVSVNEVKALIKNRNYEALLYGEALGAEPDFYSFWHSSQKVDPGLNLSSYENKDADKLIKESRETTSSDVKAEKLESLQEIIIKDAPALFLYNPNFIYWSSQEVHGIDTEKIIDPAKRFANITNWYVKTRRVWK